MYPQICGILPCISSSNSIAGLGREKQSVYYVHAMSLNTQRQKGQNEV